MDFSKLNPDTLRELIKLTELKSSLEKQLGSLNDRLTSLFTGKAPAKKAASGKRRGRPPGKPSAKKAKAVKPAKAPKAPKAAKAPKAPKASKGGGRRGALKSQILELLATAGPEGASVKDISAKLGVKNQNVHVWFSTTGKKLPEISKVGEARYAFKAAATATAQPEPESVAPLS